MNYDDFIKDYRSYWEPIYWNFYSFHQGYVTSDGVVVNNENALNDTNNRSVSGDNNGSSSNIGSNSSQQNNGDGSTSSSFSNSQRQATVSL